MSIEKLNRAMVEETPVRDNVVPLTPRAGKDQHFATIGELLTWYFEGHILSGPSTESTRTSYRCAIKNLRVHFENIDPLDLDESHQNEYIRKRKLGIIGNRGPGAASTIDGEVKIIINAINRAIKKRRLHRHARPIIEKKEKYRPKTYWITRIEAARMIRAARRVHRAKARTDAARRRMSDGELFIWIALRSGQRRDAIINLKFHTQVKFAVGEIDFQDPDKDETNKQNARQQMHPAVYRALRRRFNERPTWRATVFPDGIDINRTMKEIAIAAGLPKVTPHTFKHTFITWALAASGDLYYVSAVSATSVQTLLTTYAHAMPAVSQQKLRQWGSDKNARTSGARV